jgi:hypothetical protein
MALFPTELDEKCSPGNHFPNHSDEKVGSAIIARRAREMSQLTILAARRVVPPDLTEAPPAGIGARTGETVARTCAKATRRPGLRAREGSVRAVRRGRASNSGTQHDVAEPEI